MPDPIRVLIVDDEPAARYGMRRALERERYELIEASDGGDALRSLAQERPDLIFLDLNMPGIKGMEVLKQSQSLPAPPLVVIVTAHGSERVAVEAMKKGAFDYIAKPFDIDELRALARNAAAQITLRRENEGLKKQLRSYTEWGGLIGGSPAMRLVYDLIERVARTDVTVLVRGESGTGKEIVAQEIHRRSSRADSTFVAMNCAALPETLIESELFGHERGAFSGADQRRRGKLEAAHRGTLFLDEVGDMTPSTQAKMLRVLQERQFERLGSTEPVRVDVRFIAATNKDLAALVSAGRFRDDLLYRLRVVEMVLPPLRDRREDIPLLARHFLQQATARHRSAVREFRPAALQLLASHPWPGNVRELQNTIERAVVLARGPSIEPADLAVPDLEATASSSSPTSPPAGGDLEGLPFREARRRVIENFERRFLERKLREHGGNISQTAVALGLHRQSLQQKLKELKVPVEKS